MAAIVQGAVVRVGMMNNQQRAECVMPLICLDTLAWGVNTALNLVNGVITHIVPLIADCIDESALIMFVEAHAMEIGHVPYRQDFSPPFIPGDLGDDGCVTSNLAGLILFPEHPTAAIPGQPYKNGRMFVPGLSKTNVQNGYVDPDLHEALELLASKLILPGFDDADSKTWVRAVAARHGSSDDIQPVAGFNVMWRCATQRRRLLPRM